MTKLPEPPSPAHLTKVGVELYELPADTRLWRVYFQGGAHPSTWDAFREWGPTEARFDPHLAPASVQPDRAVLYTAQHGPTCLAEVFQDTRRIDRARRSPALVGFLTRRPLRLLDLTGAWPTRAGASMAIASGPRARARRWAQAIFEAFPEIDGVHYGSSMNGNQPSQALFARARDALPPHPVFHRRLDDPVIFDLVRNTTADLGYAVI